MTTEEKRKELETANEQISARIRTAIEEKNQLEAEILTLQNIRLDNTKQINNYLRQEIAAADSAA